MKRNKACYLRALKGFVIGLIIAVMVFLLLFGRAYPAWVQGLVGVMCIVGMVVALSVELPCTIIDDVWIYMIKTKDGEEMYETVDKKLNK